MTCLATLSSPTAPRSGSVHLIFAISYTCFNVTLPLIGPVNPFPVPLSIPAAFLRSHVVGGVRIVNEKVRSGWMVTVHGIGSSSFRWAVRALL